LTLVGIATLAACSVNTGGISFIDDDAFERAKTAGDDGGTAGDTSGVAGHGNIAGGLNHGGSAGKAGGGGSGGTANGNGGNAGAAKGGASNGGASTTAGRSSGGGGTGGDATVGEGIPISWVDGWVNGANPLKIQGAVFPYADATSAMGMISDFAGTHACIRGTAAKVDLASSVCTTRMFTPPATNCYGEYWGVAIGLNLKQEVEPTTLMGGVPMPYDATAIKGFSFTLSGSALPTSLRFKVEDSTGEYCAPTAVVLKVGVNTLKLSQLLRDCWTPTAGAATADTAKKGLIKVAWQVVTGEKAAIPFDFCVENLRALQ